MVQVRRGDVVAGGLELLDSAGLEALTTRKLAAHLGLQAGSLYWHFPSKQALLEAMADEIVAGVGSPSPGGTWDEKLAEFAHGLRRTLRAHRDGARVVAGSYVTEQNTVAVSRAWVQALRDHGLGVRDAAWGGFAVFSFVLGHVIEEQGMAELTPEQRSAKSGAVLPDGDRLDEVTAALVDAVLADPDDRFEFGLSLCLDGLRQRHTSTAARTPDARKAD
ncbi:TetR/AcrR family transcriptional regulator C-terminal domain-containing protein [Streptomyces sp. DW26H14]|uniref:TetR/AcrR family transcriptional regulator C-terminal domain-containing protein n=1 Tax=Streptomyces sp. DW26H14 TaxID=3435395 RepID=UPI00403D7B87